MITDAELLAEIQTDPANLGYAGAGAEPIANMMNAEGSAITPIWVPSSTPKPVSKEIFLQHIGTLLERAMLNRTMKSPSDIGEALDFNLTQADTLDMSMSLNRGFVDLLTALDDIPIVDTPITTTTRDAIKRLGEVQSSRAYELSGEAITVDQIKGVI